MAIDSAHNTSTTASANNTININHTAASLHNSHSNSTSNMHSTSNNDSLYPATLLKKSQSAVSLVSKPLLLLQAK